MKTLADRLKATREAKGLTVFDLSVASGVRELNIRLWEKGREPRYELLEKVAVALGVRAAWLAFGDDDAEDAAVAATV